LSLSSRFCPAADLRSLSTSPRPPHLEPISAVVTVGTVTQPPFFSDQHQPRGCRNLAGKPWFSTTVRPNATRTSSSDFSSVSPPNRSSTRSPTGLQKRPSKGQSGSDHLETLPNFRQQS
ncbi:hypothetical protein Prudu_005172, partial [Prunus dulcis]